MSQEPLTPLQIAIVEAADRLFERYGYKKTTVDEIAQAAGIGKGSIYLHFKSKEEIALAWVDQLHANLLAPLDRIANDSEPAGKRLVAYLERRILGRYDVFDRHKRSMDEALESLRPRLIEKKDAFHEREAVLLASIIESGIALGEMASPNPMEDARAMILATNSLLPYSLRPDQLGNRACVQGKATGLAGLLLRSVSIVPNL